MKNSILFVAILVFLGACSDELVAPNDRPRQEQQQWVNHITMNQAKKRLVSIVSEINSQIPAGVNRIPAISETTVSAMQCTPLSEQLKPLTRGEDETDAGFYVMRMDNDMFAIMSATTDKPELLAIGNGYPNFEDSTANLPNPNYWAMPTGADIGIGTIPDTASIKPFYVYKRISTTYSPMYDGGLCKVKWGNEAPYNEMMDTVTDPWGNVKHAAAGCVAIAMAQMMTVPNLRGGYYKDDVFDWDDLANRRDATCFNNPTARTQIASLFRDLNNEDNLDSQQASPTTWASTSSVPRVFRNFHFKQGGIMTTFDDTESTFKAQFDSIRHELDLGYPIYFDGKADYVDPNNKDTLEGGHAWICHGMMKASTLIEVYAYASEQDALTNTEPIYVGDYIEESWFLQMNWGWDSKADGYYIAKYGANFDSTQGPDETEIDVPKSKGWNNIKPNKSTIIYKVRK